MASILSLKEIPTLSALYRLGRITPCPYDTAPPSQTYNDKISVLKYDITKLEVDSIVNAANESLLGGGGVDGAIHQAAGPDLLDECSTLNGCSTGSAKITAGYELPAKKVIHAVGPIYRKERRHMSLLQGCYTRSLELAVENNLKSIAFPAISTGVYGYPSREAAETAIEAVRNFLVSGKGDSLERIIFCNFLQKDQDAYLYYLSLHFPAVKEEEKDEKSLESS